MFDAIAIFCKGLALLFVDFVSDKGYIGIFLMMTLESTSIPVILPAEVVLITAGYHVGLDEMNGFIVVLVATLGSICGSFINYYFAHFVGRKILYKYGKYILLSADRIMILEMAFKKHASIVTFSGRLMPLIKHIVSIPAGMCQMDKMKFTLWTGLGSCLLAVIMVNIGISLGKNIDRFDEYKYYIVGGLLLFSFAIIIVYYFYHKFFLSRFAKILKRRDMFKI